MIETSVIARWIGHGKGINIGTMTHERSYTRSGCRRENAFGPLREVRQGSVWRKSRRSKSCSLYTHCQQKTLLYQDILTGLEVLALWNPKRCKQPNGFRLTCFVVIYSAAFSNIGASSAMVYPTVTNDISDCLAWQGLHFLLRRCGRQTLPWRGCRSEPNALSRLEPERV